MTAVRLRAIITGRVQGVGFREWTRRTAEQLGLVGSATNLPDGRVEVIAEGSRAACERLLAAFRSGPTPGHVRDVDATWAEADGSSHRFLTG